MADNRRLMRQLIWLMFHRRAFMQDFSERIEPEFFGSNEARYLARLALHYWEDQQALLPETGVFNALDDDEDDEKLEEYGVSYKACEQLWDALEPVKNNETEYFWKAADDFCRRQGLGLALREATEVLDDEGPAAAMKVIDLARIKLEPRTMKTAKVFGGITEMLGRLRIKHEEGNFASTGLPKLDRYLGGGVLPGEFAAFIAPTGRGKTMWLCHVAAKGYMFGLEVLYYTLEVDRDEISLRTLSSVSGVSINDMKLWAMYGRGDGEDATADGRETPEDAIQKLYKRIALIGGNRREVDVIDLGQATVQTIAADIDRRKREGGNPKLVVIDYADRLTPTVHREKKEHEELQIFRDLVALAKDEQVAIWTAIQGNRQSLGRKNVDLRQISGAYAKAWEADFVIAGGQDDAMMKRNQFNFLLAKVRRVGTTGHTGGQLDVRYDFATTSFRDWVKPGDEDELTGTALTYVGEMDFDPDDEGSEAPAPEHQNKSDGGYHG